MKNIRLSDEVLASWARCINEGLSSAIPFPTSYLAGETLHDVLEKDKILITVFEESLKNINRIYTGECLFLLTDGKGTLLKKKWRPDQKNSGFIGAHRGDVVC